MSSGGTARAIADAGVPVTDVAELTGLPAILGHRVVTLHPKIHGGILADPTDAEHVADMEHHGIEPIDLVVVNLYPFSSDPSIELIDIGGPAMVRAAAKNHAHVGVRRRPGRLRAGARRAARRRRAAATDPSTSRPHGVRPHRCLRRRDRHVVRRDDGGRFDRPGARSAALDPPRARAGPTAALRREPAPAGCPLPPGRRCELVGLDDAARRQGAQLPQPVRHRGGVAARAPIRRSGVRRSSSTPTRAVSRSPPTSPRPTSGRTRAIRSARSAASSLRTAP